MQTSDYRWRLDTRLLVWCLATRLCDRLLNVNSSGEWSSRFILSRSHFSARIPWLKRDHDRAFGLRSLKETVAEKYDAKKVRKSRSRNTFLHYRSCMITFTYVSIAFFLFSERTFVQSMIHNGLSIVKISEEFLGYLGFYWEWKMDVLYVFLYILIFFLSFLYLYVCLSRKGFIRLDTFLNGLLNIWKLIWSIINVLAFETKICDN